MRSAVALSPGIGRRALPRQRGQITPIPAPTDGWDASTPLALMSPTRARLMVNFWPEPDKVTLRRGYEGHATGIGEPVETLAAYSNTKLFAVGDGTIYDVTSAGAAVSAQGGFTNSRFQTENFATSNGPYLVLANGADSLQIYDGSDFSAPSISGLTSSTIISVAASKEKLWFAVNSSIDAWYLATGAIAGTATRFPLGGVFKRGGILQAIGNWSRDGGQGAEDLTCFFSSLGEVAVYSGYDPSTASNWVLVGVYQIGRPIGRRCLTKLGGELAVITEYGIQPLSSALIADTAQQQAVAVSQRIQTALQEYARLYATNFGWECSTYADRGMLILNIPLSTTRSVQCVMNLQHGAWTLFEGMSAHAFEEFGGDLYFADDDGVIWHADTGQADDGETILYDVQTAEIGFGYPGIKKYLNVRPVFLTNGTPAPTIEMVPDFGDQAPAAVTSEAATDYALWDLALWDVSLWAPESYTYQDWSGAKGIGNTASIRMRIDGSGFILDWVRTDVRWEPGAGL